MPKVSLVQQKCSEDKEQNIQTSFSRIEQAKKLGAELVVLQELHTTQYFCQEHSQENFALAESADGTTVERFRNLAKEKNLVLVISIFEEKLPGLYHNTAVTIEKNGNIAGIYRKMHIPEDPGFHEKYYFRSGDLGFKTAETSLGKLGVLVCWDQWFPEAARLMALDGADILIYPTAIGWIPGDLEENKKQMRENWITIQRSHSIANGLPVISVNRVGIEYTRTKNSQINFWGSSFISDANGKVLSMASVDQEALLVEEIDLFQTKTVRQTWPFMRDRRVDFYKNLL